MARRDVDGKPDRDAAPRRHRGLVSAGRNRVGHAFGQNIPNPGKGFAAYGLRKATTFFLLRHLALQLGAKGIRVNGINADRIRSGLLSSDMIQSRSVARGVDEATYMAGNLLRDEVEARYVADAFVMLARAERTIGHVMAVDGGNIEAALR